MSDLRTFRSTGIIVVAWGSAVILVVLTVAIGVALPAESRFTRVQTASIGLLVLAWVFMSHIIARSRVTADKDFIEILNGVTRHRFSWSEVQSISMRPGAPWPTLVTHEDRRVILFGIQGSEGPPAQRAVEWLQGHVS